MTLKRALIATAIWTLLMVVVSGVAIWYITSHPIPGVRTEDRASKLGGGLGLLTGIGYGVIWLPYAAKVGKARREARTKPRKSSTPRKA